MHQRKGIEIEELQHGTGGEATRGTTVEIRYDASLQRGDTVQTDVQCRFKVGGREVIAGLEYGVEGMRVGVRRKIRISPHLAYGTQGVLGVIPANAVLRLEVELLSIEEGDSTREL